MVALFFLLCTTKEMELGKISKDNLSEVKLNGFKTEKRGTLGNIKRENVKTRRRENVFSGRERERTEELKK